MNDGKTQNAGVATDRLDPLVGRGSFRRLIRNLSKRNEATNEIVSALYFGDSADYKKALWSSLRILDSELCEIAERDLKEAFQKSQNDSPNRGIDGKSPSMP